MPRRHLALRVRDEAGGRALRAGFARIREELDVPADLPPDVLAEAEEAARSADLTAYDLVDLPFLTIDPPGSTDLDQAMHLERSGRGYRVRYAIADVGAYVRTGRCDRRRGAPSGRDALQSRHPHAPAPAGAVGGRRVLAPRRDPRGRALDDRPRRGG